MQFIKVENYEQLSEKAAQIIADVVINKPDCVLGLATGSSPIGTYKNLVKWNKEGKLDFSKVMSINLDEYEGLDGEHDQSYRYFMNNNLFNHINIDKANTFVPNGKAADIDAECKTYDQRIADHGIDIQLCQDAVGISVDMAENAVLRVSVLRNGRSCRCDFRISAYKLFRTDTIFIIQQI